MARQRVTRQQFFDEVFHGSVPRDENGEIRITRAFPDARWTSRT